MAAEVLYGKNDTYFNMSRFENSIGNLGIEKQRMMETKKNIMLFDRLLFMVFVVLFVAVVLLFARIIYEDIKIRNGNHEIAKLEETLATTKSDGIKLMGNIKDGIKYDTLKAKAYLELNMITPTENNIIYFEKSDAEHRR